MTTVSIQVSRNGATRKVTVLASQLVAWEIASVVLTFVAGFLFGKF